MNDSRLHKIFFTKCAEIYESLDVSIWTSLGDSAWRSASDKEVGFLLFCEAFVRASSEKVDTEAAYDKIVVETETDLRDDLMERGYTLKKKMRVNLNWIVDGLETRREVRTLQANYGVSIVGPVLDELSASECETKYQRALKIIERLAL